MLVILTSHPIQYQAPLWRALAKDGRVSFEVWFLTDHAVKPTLDREFGKSFAWDNNLLEGYSYRFLPVKSGWRMDRFTGIQVTQSWTTLFRQHQVTHLWVEGWRFWENWAAIFCARREGIEIWLRGETNDLRPRRGWRAHARKLLLGRLFCCVNRFLCIGTANKRFYHSFAVEAKRLISTPYCVDNDWFSGEAERIKERRLVIRRSWGIPDDAFCLLFCGKFIEKKRPMDLVMAVRTILERLPESRIHLLFVGSGILAEALKGACQITFDSGSLSPTQANLSGSIPKASFVGFLNQGQIISAYVSADALVLPSDFGETWGLVINEAMATGLPCIASNQCGCAEDLVEPQAKTAVFPVGDVSQLAKAIEAVVSHPVPKSELKRLIAEYSLEKTVISVASVFSNNETHE